MTSCKRGSKLAAARASTAVDQRKAEYQTIEYLTRLLVCAVLPFLRTVAWFHEFAEWCHAIDMLHVICFIGTDFPLPQSASQGGCVRKSVKK
jgi:hypothetical protein